MCECLCDTLWWLRKKKIPSHRCLEAEEEEQQGRARSSCASLSDKSRRNFKRHFSAIYDFVCRMHPMQPRGAWALLGGHREIQSPELGTNVLRNGDKVALRLCHTGWGHAGAARAAQLTVPGQRRSGRE